MNTSALKSAIAAAGGTTALARVAGVAPPTIHVWLRSTGRIPASRVLAIEAATGISRHELRPDIYPVEDQQAA